MLLPRSWVSLSPNGLGHQKPNHFGDMVKVAWKVKGRSRDAWKILTKGICDGCALGVAGFHDWTLDGVHLCTTRLNLLPMNLARPFDPAIMRDVSPLREMSSAELRGLGRIAHPMRRRRGETGFTRITWDQALTSQILVDGDDVIVLPAATRYEQEGGGTSTTTERRIAFSPQVLDPPGEARSEWRIFGDLATRVRPDLVDCFAWADNQALRAEIAALVPLYQGIEALAETGDAVQYGGRHLCPGGQFPTPTGRAQFSLLDVSPDSLGPAEFFCSTRRGKQFNTMVYAEIDPLTGAARDAVYLDRSDAASLGISEGDPLRPSSATGFFDGHAKLVRLPHQSVQVHWPEGNVLLASAPSQREPLSRIPDYNTVVTVERR